MFGNQILHVQRITSREGGEALYVNIEPILRWRGRPRQRSRVRYNTDSRLCCYQCTAGMTGLRLGTDASRMPLRLLSYKTKKHDLA